MHSTLTGSLSTRSSIIASSARTPQQTNNLAIIPPGSPIISPMQGFAPFSAVSKRPGHKTVTKYRPLDMCARFRFSDVFTIFMSRRDSSRTGRLVPLDFSSQGEIRASASSPSLASLIPPPEANCPSEMACA
jgi:hypothetical protein